MGVMPRPIAAALAALATLALAGCAAAAAPRHHAAASPAPAPVSSATAPASSAPGISAWLDGAGYRDFKKLAGQFSLPGKAYKSGGMPAEAKACATLAARISAAQQAPPIPDAQAERDYSLALTDWETGAVDCQAGASASNVALLDASVAHTTAGAAYFQKATRRIVALIKASG
jgi:hypothetical protein